MMKPRFFIYLQIQLNYIRFTAPISKAIYKPYKIAHNSASTIEPCPNLLAKARKTLLQRREVSTITVNLQEALLWRLPNSRLIPSNTNQFRIKDIVQNFTSANILDQCLSFVHHPICICPGIAKDKGPVWV